MAKLELELIFEGQDSDVVLGMYIDSEMVDDISQAGWNLCDCDDLRYAKLIGECVIVTSSLNKGKADIVLSVIGSDASLIEQTIQVYLDGFEDYIRPTLLELRSRTGDKYDFSLKEFNFVFKETA
jgi:hypothetical protein